MKKITLLIVLLLCCYGNAFGLSAGVGGISLGGGGSFNQAGTYTLTGSWNFTGTSSVTFGPIQFEGATVDDFEIGFSITDPTADRLIYVGNFDTEIPADTAVDSSGKILKAGLASDATDREVAWTTTNSDTATAIADGKQAFIVPAGMVGMNLVDVTASVHDLNAASGGATTVVIRRVRGATAADMTSTGVTIAYTDYTASDETVDTANDDLALGDKIYVDVDAVTTGAAQKGLSVTATFRVP